MDGGGSGVRGSSFRSAARQALRSNDEIPAGGSTSAPAPPRHPATSASVRGTAVAEVLQALQHVPAAAELLLPAAGGRAPVVGRPSLAAAAHARAPAFDTAPAESPPPADGASASGAITAGRRAALRPGSGGRPEEEGSEARMDAAAGEGSSSSGGGAADVRTTVANMRAALAEAMREGGSISKALEAASAAVARGSSTSPVARPDSGGERAEAAVSSGADDDTQQRPVSPATALRRQKILEGWHQIMQLERALQQSTARANEVSTNRFSLLAEARARDREEQIRKEKLTMERLERAKRGVSVLVVPPSSMPPALAAPTAEVEAEGSPPVVASPMNRTSTPLLVNSGSSSSANANSVSALAPACVVGSTSRASIAPSVRSATRTGGGGGSGVTAGARPLVSSMYQDVVDTSRPALRKAAPAPVPGAGLSSVSIGARLASEARRTDLWAAKLAAASPLATALPPRTGSAGAASAASAAAASGPTGVQTPTALGSARTPLPARSASEGRPRAPAAAPSPSTVETMTSTVRLLPPDDARSVWSRGSVRARLADVDLWDSISVRQRGGEFDDSASVMSSATHTAAANARRDFVARNIAVAGRAGSSFAPDEEERLRRLLGEDGGGSGGGGGGGDGVGAAAAAGGTRSPSDDATDAAADVASHVERDSRTARRVWSIPAYGEGEDDAADGSDGGADEDGGTTLSGSRAASTLTRGGTSLVQRMQELDQRLADMVSAGSASEYAAVALRQAADARRASAAASLGSAGGGGSGSDGGGRTVGAHPAAQDEESSMGLHAAALESAEASAQGRVKLHFFPFFLTSLPQWEETAAASPSLYAAAAERESGDEHRAPTAASVRPGFEDVEELPAEERRALSAARQRDVIAEQRVQRLRAQRLKAIDDALAALQSSFNVETADAQSVPDAATVMSAGSARTAGGTTVYKRVTARDIEAEAAAARAQLLQAAAGTARATSSRASLEGTHVDTRRAGAQSAHDDGDAGARDSDVARLLAPKEQIEALLRGLNAAGARESMHTVYEAPLPPVYE